MVQSKVNHYGILASGVGTNALSLINTGLMNGCPPRFVICNKEESPLLTKAKEIGIPTYFIPSSVKGIDKDFENRVLNLCQTHNVDWLFLAGFLKILSSAFLQEFNFHGFNQVVNIHPSLLPKYPGLGGYKLAHRSGDKEFGHTIHLVTDGVDEGPILFQKILTRGSDLSLEEMIAIGKEEENKSYGLLLSSLLKNGWQWDGNELRIAWNYP